MELTKEQENILEDLFLIFKKEFKIIDLSIIKEDTKSEIITLALKNLMRIFKR